MFYKAIIQTPLGKLKISILDQLLTRLDFLTDNKALIDPHGEVLNNITNQLYQYFEYPNFQFNIPYQLQGTPFQKTVWQTLTKLPIQKTVNYGTLAKKLKTGARGLHTELERVLMVHMFYTKFYREQNTKEIVIDIDQVNIPRTYV